MVRIRRMFVAMALLAAAPACTHWQQMPITNREHPSGWGDEIREAGVEAYLYAMMSNNAYDDSSRFDLGPDIITVTNDASDPSGFAYSVFERRGNGQLLETVIAFRGTELGFLDIWRGSITAEQNSRGLALYDRIKAAAGNSPVNVTGHSLGGGIATQVSLQRENVRSYIFNASPRFNRRGPIPENRRLSIVERGEVLKLLRIPGREAPQEYISINCIPGFNPIQQHSIRLLAECLTRMAAWHDPAARAALDRNSIAWPRGLPRE
jgi:pimeloyl-ACP methyl ester carboxylesterase